MRAVRGLRRVPRAPALAIVASLVVPASQPPRHQIHHAASRPAAAALHAPAPAEQAPAAQAPAGQTPATQTPTSPVRAGPVLAVPAGVLASTRIVPDTVRIGEPFAVVLRVQAPRSATLVFPAGPDSSTIVEALDPRTVAVVSDSASSRYTATYRLAAWDLGRQPITFAPATVRGGSADGAVPFGALTVVVRPTAPADAAHRIPRAARDLFAMPRAWWPLWQILLVTLGACLAIWLLSRWWRRRPRAGPARANPFADATREFDTLERIGLLDAGEPGRYVALSTGITRAYLVRRLAPESMALTSAELIAAVAGDRRIPHARLRALLAESDRVKFARESLTADAASAMGADARRLVEDVEQRVTAAEAAADAAAAAAAAAAATSGTRGSAA